MGRRKQLKEFEYPLMSGEELKELQELAIKGLQEDPCMERLWETLLLFAGSPFQTFSGLQFEYAIRGKEVFVNRKNKSLTQATVRIAFQKVLELGNGRLPAEVVGPKKLNCFGASYFFAIFLYFGLIVLPEDRQLSFHFDE